MASTLWFLKKGFSFLATLLHNSTINFIYETVCQCGKSVANTLWSLKKGFSFLAALLHNSTTNFIYETVCQCG